MPGPGCARKSVSARPPTTGQSFARCGSRTGRHQHADAPSCLPGSPPVGGRLAHLLPHFGVDALRKYTFGGASAPAPDAVSAQQLIAEYAAACTHRPPKDVLGHLGREVHKLLGEGITPAHIRAGLERHRAKGLHPSTLPSLVHEAMNATPVPVAHRVWTNPTDVDAAYGGDL
jgi:hypothetical protein